MTTANTYYGYTPQQWSQPEAVMTTILEEVAHNNQLIEYQTPDSG